jgi:hypothetical protein
MAPHVLHLGEMVGMLDASAGVAIPAVYVTSSLLPQIWAQ